jgi:polyisoprenyl-teichoic acid--peptidoglycan teichoic acid transferase
MYQRILPCLLVFSLLVTACSGDEATETPRPSVSSTTSEPITTSSSTTTTTVPVTVEAAPDGLVETIKVFYDYAGGASSTEPAAPAEVIAAITPGEVETPRSGVASLAAFGGDEIAVVEMDPDLFLAVDDGEGWRIVGGEWPSLGVDAYFGSGPRHLAVVGSDARPGENPLRTRADSIHFVALNGEGSGAVVGLPRDSYIPVPGMGRMKITNSLARGGPEPMMEAFGDLTGLPLEGYVLTGFSGFTSLIDVVLGGVTVEVPFAINDRWAHVALSAGEQILDGAQALGFARARKTVSGGDFTRSEHQGVVLLAAAGAVQAMGMSAIPELMEASEPYLDTDLSPEDLLTFSAMAISADLDSVVNLVAPGRPGSAGGASVVFLSDSANDLWANLADGRLDP